MSLTGLAFLGLFFAGILLAVFKHPFYGLYTYIYVFYADPPDRWWSHGIPDIRWSLVAALATMIGLSRLHDDRNGPGWLSSTPVKLLIAYTVWVWIQYSWALLPDEQLNLAILFTKYIVLLYLLHRLLVTETDLRNFALVHVAGCVYLGWLAWHATGGGRVQGLGGPGIQDANALGMHLATGLLFASMLLLIVRRQYWVGLVLAIPLILLGIKLTESRSAFLGLLSGGLAAVYLKPRTYRKAFYIYAVLAMIPLGYILSKAYWHRIQTIAYAVDKPQDVDNSAQTRINLFFAQWKMFEEYPLGTGHRGTAALSTYFLPKKDLSNNGERSSHNTMMTTLVEQGIPGFIIYIWAVVWVFVTLRRMKALDRWGLPPALGVYRAMLGAALACIFISGQFVDLLKAEVMMWSLGMLVALTRLCAPYAAVADARRRCMPEGTLVANGRKVGGVRGVSQQAHN